jgi:hypothetical protein
MVNNTYQKQAVITARNAILSLSSLPARLDASETATVLGMREHDVPILVAEKLLTPLGRPAENAVKYFAAVEIRTLAEDPKWLAIATQAIYEHWRTKNKNKTKTVSADLETSLVE